MTKYAVRLRRPDNAETTTAVSRPLTYGEAKRLVIQFNGIEEDHALDNPDYVRYYAFIDTWKDIEK